MEDKDSLKEDRLSRALCVHSKPKTKYNLYFKQNNELDFTVHLVNHSALDQCFETRAEQSSLPLLKNTNTRKFTHKLQRIK